MITLLIGHRGSGKTTFLKSLKQKTFDLDEELEKMTGHSVSDLFAQGEASFRELESMALKKLCQGLDNAVIALGAGFVGEIPRGARVIWIRRVTDSAGRCFLDRPRLNEKISPFEEYKERFAVREARYAELADEQLLIPEGYRGGLEDFVGQPIWEIPYDFTLLPEHFKSWPAFIERRKDWGVRRWEVRDDLLTPEQIALALKLPNVLFSRRIKDSHVPEGCTWDWPLELGSTDEKPYSISLHEREEDFSTSLARLEFYGEGAQLKLAVEVKDFNELQQGHKWWLKDPTHRSFLPRSPNGRWRWYRSLFGPKMPIHFFRESEGSGLDQPTLWQCVLQPKFKDKFGAVLGSPVEHSRTPIEQRGFVSIQVSEDEYPFAIEFLKELGLTMAAVTSPLKKIAWASATNTSRESKATQAANTLHLSHAGVFAHNTDVLALKEIAKQIPEFQNIWLWGGGGIKSSVKAAWPNAIEVSARLGDAPPGNPDLVIWATGRGRPFKWPSPQVRPTLILDLNYAEDSPGLEWAVREKLPYQSGLTMFKLQAEFQRHFWRERGEDI